MTDKEKQLIYYNGFSDGTHACNMAIIAMVEKVTDMQDLTKVKMVIAHTAKILADISDETNVTLDQLLKQCTGGN